MSDPDGHLIERLRQAPPFQEGVDFAAVARDVARQRRVVVLRYVEDMSIEQVAELLDLAPGTVKSQAARGLVKMREALGHE